MPQPLVPMVPAPPAGYAPVQADVDSWITTPFSFLASPTVLRAELHAATTWNAAAFTLAPLDTILEDPWGGWSATLTASQPAFSWLCPAGCSGIYEVSLTAWTTSPGSTLTDQVQAVLFVDGSNYMQASAGWGVSGGQSGSCASVQVPLVGGVDYVQFEVYSTAATAAPATAGRYPTMDIAFISTT